MNEEPSCNAHHHDLHTPLSVSRRRAPDARSREHLITEACHEKIHFLPHQPNDHRPANADGFQLPA